MRAVTSGAVIRMAPSIFQAHPADEDGPDAVDRIEIGAHRITS